MSVAFYILLLCGLICSSCCVSFARDKFLVKFFQGVTFLILFLPAAFRYGIGVDYFSYVEIFDRISSGNIFSIDPGWGLLNKWICVFGGNAQTLIALTAFLTYFFLLCEVESEKWFIYVPAFFLIFYTWTFTTLRQMLAGSMCFFALCRIQKKKYVLAVIISFLSFFIHNSVLVYLVVYALVKIFRLKKKVGILLVFVSYVISIMFGTIIRDVVLMVALFTPYAHYLNSDWASATEVSTGIGRLLRYVVYFFLVFFFPKRKSNSKIFTLLLLYICIDFFGQHIEILGRINRLIIYLFLPLAWVVYSEKKKYDIPFFVYICCYLLLFLLELYGGFHGSIPYMSIFQI